MTGAVIRGRGFGVPPSRTQDELWKGFFRAHHGGDATAAKVWRGAGISRRHAVIDPCTEDVSSWSTGARMDRYLQEALPLGKEAVSGALADAGVAPEEVGLFSVVSCTGYTTPGLDILLARDLGMSVDVQRLLVGHMGCYAALPALGAASDFVVARGRPVVQLCLELCSLHVQPAANLPGAPGPDGRQRHDVGQDDIEQMVAHALFADAAAALVLTPDTDSVAAGAGFGYEVVDVVARTDATTSDHMSWRITDNGFRMGLSPRVPAVLGRHVRPVVSGLLARHGLALRDVRGWAIHPGGPRILDVVGQRLELTDTDLAPSYEVLRTYGNASSATVLLVLDQLEPAPGDHVVVMAFGPGLTLYAALLRAL